MATIEPYQTVAGTRYAVRYRKPDGKTTKKRGFTTKKAATAYGNTIEVHKLTGDYIDPRTGRITIGTLAARWLGNRSGLTPSTVVNTESAYNAHVAEHWAHRAAGDIKPSDVRAWVSGLEKAGVGTATIEKALGVLRQILEAADEDNIIANNPCDRIKAPRRRHNQRGYLTHQQVHELSAEVATHPQVILFLAYTGLRWGEMAALKVRSFDMLRRRIHITEALSEVHGAIVWGNVKNHERRTVPYPAFLADQLAPLMAGKSRDDIVFTGELGEILRVSNYRPRIYNLAVARCKGRSIRQRQAEEKRGTAVTPEFPTVTVHDLRHTAASLAISAGANVKAVQTMLGHKSAAMTLDTYADLFPDDLEAVAAALDQAARDSVPKMCPNKKSAPPRRSGNGA